MIAEGLVSFLRQRKEEGKKSPPFVVRLRGTGEDEAKGIVSPFLSSFWSFDFLIVQIQGAKDLDNIQYIPDLKDAATEASRIAATFTAATAGLASAADLQPVAMLSPVVFGRDGQYEHTAKNIMVKEGAKVLIMGTGKAVGAQSAYDREEYRG